MGGVPPWLVLAACTAVFILAGCADATPSISVQAPLKTGPLDYFDLQWTEGTGSDGQPVFSAYLARVRVEDFKRGEATRSACNWNIRKRRGAHSTPRTGKHKHQTAEPDGVDQVGSDNQRAPTAGTRGARQWLIESFQCSHGRDHHYQKPKEGAQICHLLVHSCPDYGTGAVGRRAMAQFLTICFIF